MVGTRTGRSRHLIQRRLLVLAAAVAGGALAASPTGVGAIDIAWCAGFAGVLAYWGGFTPRLVLLPVGAAAVVLADTRLSLGLALAVVVVAGGNAIRPRFSNRWGAAAGGLLGCALLTGNGPSERPLALVTTSTLVVGLFVASHRQMTRRRRIQNWWGLAVLGGVVLLFGAAGGLAGLLARGSIDDGIDAFRSAQTEGVGGNLDDAVQAFQLAEAAFRDAGGPLDSFGQLGRLVPGLSQQLAAANVAVDAAGDAAEAGRRAGRSIDLDDIAVSGGGVDLGALVGVEPAMGQLSSSLATSVARLERIDRELLLPQLDDALDDALSEATDASVTADRLHRALQVAPRLLGADGPRRYLVLFTTPVEARGRIGFPGGYAVVRFEAGRLRFESADDMGALDNPRAADPATLTIPPGAAPYAAYRATEAWRSVTLIPDAPTSADLVRQFARVAPGIGSVDGVVYADPQALAALVGLVGSIDVPGVGAITADTTFDYITRRQYLEFADANDERKDILGAIAGVVGTRLQDLSLPSIRTLTEVFGPVVEGGHLMFTVDPAADPDAAALLADTRADGAFPRPGDLEQSDVLFVASRNSSGNKIDLFLERKLDFRTVVDELGEVQAELSIELTNNSPAGGLPFYVIGSSVTPAPPLGWNLSSTFIYSRLRLETLTVDGQAVLPLVSYDDTVYLYQVQTDLAPGQTRVIEARLAGEAIGEAAQVVVFPGGLATPDEVSIAIEDARTGVSVDERFTANRPECRAARPDPTDCR